MNKESEKCREAVALAECVRLLMPYARRCKSSTRSHSDRSKIDTALTYSQVALRRAIESGKI